jgi:hypothetical protein
MGTPSRSSATVCEDCLETYQAADALPPTSDMLKIVAMVQTLYERPGCGAGGPLHVVLDDFNLEDGMLVPWSEPPEFTWPVDVMALASIICGQLSRMSLAERAAVVGLAHGLIPADPNALMEWSQGRRP